MIPVGGLLTYVFVYRWPKNAGRIDAAGVILHNIGLALWIAAIWAMAGLPGLIIYAGTVFTAGCIGVFLVYLQHNFEDTWWDRKPDLNPARAALQGSSALDLGWWWDLGPATSPITTSTISTPTSPPTGCANATARCARNTRCRPSAGPRRSAPSR
jgi:omega-6 fatty acid desaturase (delta-12 desaturase)